jgi:hypothetical protein
VPLNIFYEKVIVSWRCMLLRAFAISDEIFLGGLSPLEDFDDYYQSPFRFFLVWFSSLRLFVFPVCECLWIFV